MTNNEELLCTTGTRIVDRTCGVVVVGAPAGYRRGKEVKGQRVFWVSYITVVIVVNKTKTDTAMTAGRNDASVWPSGEAILYLSCCDAVAKRNMAGRAIRACKGDKSASATPRITTFIALRLHQWRHSSSRDDINSWQKVQG